MKISDSTVGFIGFGHMAQILFKAMDRSKIIEASQVFFTQKDPGKMRKNEEKFKIRSRDLKHLLEGCDLLILSVRPHQAESVLKEIKQIGLDPSKLFISILAGVKLSFYQQFLKMPIVRLMPNIASEVGFGMSVFSFSSDVSREHQSLSRLLFSCMGRVSEVSEDLMDISCAIAGSGPGFVFKLIEAMGKAGESEGLASSLALEMAAQTFLGAAELVLKKGDVGKLLTQIATPHGTTEAGLNAMDEEAIAQKFQKAIFASSKRSKELS